jgi:2-methylisocitrate lyase-like PEP mutase family enzyme
MLGVSTDTVFSGSIVGRFIMSFAAKGTTFKALHRSDKAFIIPNPYDAGTAKLLEIAGFKALATTSAGYAFAAGRPDNNIGRQEMIDHAAIIVEATNLPVSADLENGFFDAPKEVMKTIQMAADIGLVGGSIEDSTNDGRTNAQYDVGFAKERVAAAARAAGDADFPFTLTARAENFLVGNPDIADTIKRLQAYQEAGADVLFAPGLTSVEDIRSVVSSIDVPLNVVMGLSGVQLSQKDLSELGVKRISTGSSLSRAALGAFMRAAREMTEQGTFSYAEDALPFFEINRAFGGD